MVQNISAQSVVGEIKKVGNTPNGRVIYQISDASGQKSKKISVAQNDCDTFEKTFNTFIDSANKLQKYSQETTPAQMEKNKKKAKWIIVAGTILGGIGPLLKIKCNSVWNIIKAALFTGLGAGVGLFAGSYVASKTLTPKGAKELAEATRTMSKLDVQPVEE